MAAAGDSDAIDLVVVTMRFDAAGDEQAGDLVAVLSRYVVLTRMDEACRNVDLCAAAGARTRFLVIEKWEQRSAQRAHLDSDVMVQMAESCRGLLSAPPAIERWDAASAHDLR
jgi:quinol monooxygenase YgiN